MLFSYCRVSTTEQTTSNQLLAIENRGYKTNPNFNFSETISGSTSTVKRPVFSKMMEQLRSEDTLIVLKLDRLGRDNIDVQNTIKKLINKGVSVVSLDLPVGDLSLPENKLMLQMFAAFSEFELNRLRERTKQGLERAKSEGVSLGRPVAVKTTSLVQSCKQRGLSQSKTAIELSISIATVKRHWNQTFKAVINLSQADF